ncbi:hypothetical protein [Aureimonas mangrovi]|uniref:hypothetical protein n=1 Tax=Aureimonas mangrovi TaxID=2758041 RepID=UPI00163D609F|nr:hypothetical protein [Aureimonas mangrovi]
MDLTALRTFRFGDKNIRRGMPVTMSEARAKEHLSRGLVEETKSPAPKPKADPKSKADEKAKD